MKFYYIDDSMLARNEFATSVLHRFECWLEHHPADLILVSAARKDNPQLRHFVEAMPEILSVYLILVFFPLEIPSANPVKSLNLRESEEIYATGFCA